MKSILIRRSIGGLGAAPFIALAMLSGCPGPPPPDAGVPDGDVVDQGVADGGIGDGRAVDLVIADSGAADSGMPDQSPEETDLGECTPQSDLAMERADLLGLSTNLSAPITLSYPDGQHLFAIADFNGDGAADILSIGNSGIWLALNRGCRGFLGPTRILGLPGVVGGADWVSLATGDFNGDGRADFAYRIWTLGVAYSLSLPNGSFTALTSIKEPFGAFYNVDALAIGDLNGDGKADLMLGNATASSDDNGRAVMPDGRVMTFFSDGKGGFSAPVPSKIACSPFAMVAADVDGDGWTDVVCSGGTVLFNDQHGNLGPDFAWYRLTGNTRLILVGDINGDGLPEIFSFVDTFYTSPPNGWALAMNQGHRMFAPPTVLTAPYPYAAALGDLNGDGRPDFVTEDDSGYRMAVRFNLGGGKFAPPFEIHPPGGGSNGGIRVADMDGDHKPDIIINDGTNKKIQVFFNDWR